MKHEDFYVGYHRQAPATISVFMRRTVASLVILAASLGLAFALSQTEFDRGSFAFRDYRPHAGILRLKPYPRLGEFWLVMEGKRGFDPAGLGPEGNSVSLRGALIQNGIDKMLEVRLGSAQPRSAKVANDNAAHEPGSVELTGEIVDTKCYLGVMNPGRGKVHRACAARCLSGGIPAGLLVRDVNGEVRVVILASSSGESISRLVAPLAGERVTVGGVLIRSGDSLILRAREPVLAKE